jgi:hypothetical protein
VRQRLKEVALAQRLSLRPTKEVALAQREMWVVALPGKGWSQDRWRVH